MAVSPLTRSRSPDLGQAQEDFDVGHDLRNEMDTNNSVWRCDAVGDADLVASAVCWRPLDDNT